MPQSGGGEKMKGGYMTTIRRNPPVPPSLSNLPLDFQAMTMLLALSV